MLILKPVGKIHIEDGAGVIVEGLYLVFADNTQPQPTLYVEDGEDLLFLEDLNEDSVKYLWV